ncbi:RES family NAD+ phosphorylase [Enterocloster bolteae]|uniref:RES family NAD+ phosphorylase n=1 Tax=Enterocloster bolteae TaxID=208479 RepID=UPI00210DF269|nr:RES family NAD+ phosphorylase [Enterocloster bolteae]MCQ4755782.1 RES family NAD+ phosphorylase [Enterocloster bolteae]
MSLSDKIENAKIMAEALANCTIEKHKEFVWNYSFQSDLKKIVNDDLMHNNPDTLFEEYKEYFKTKALPTKIIATDTVFYRGRIGNEVIYGAEDDHNRSFILPYYQHGIEAPPPIYTNGGRFNRQGISYLYLADTIETCLAEVHLQIGQNCSIGEFKCKEQMEVIDLTRFDNNGEMETWLKILTQPVYNGTEHIYNITRFLADIFKSINSNGIYFESVQAEGHNIVCFDPSLFQLVEYSEKIYAATKIKYAYQQVEDSIQEYSKNRKNKYIDSYNEYENEKNEKKFEYLNDWIENKRENITKRS